jgi:Pyruvate/2-oxoacid:ferredoxin oxidoreductase delta subunit
MSLLSLRPRPQDLSSKSRRARSCHNGEEKGNDKPGKDSQSSFQAKRNSNQVMWGYSDSELDDDMVVRCSYCGRFCSQGDIVGEDGLCHKCSEELNLSSSRGGEAMSTVSGEAIVADDVSLSSSLGGTANSPTPSQNDTDPRDDDNDSGGLCARCWAHPSKKLLYNTPICDDCFHVAQMKRVRVHLFNGLSQTEPEHQLADIHQKGTYQRHEGMYKSVVEQLGTEPIA